MHDKKKRKTENDGTKNVKKYKRVQKTADVLKGSVKKDEKFRLQQF